MTGVTRTGGADRRGHVRLGRERRPRAATPGAQTWQIQESSTAAGALTSIGASPVDHGRRERRIGPL